MASPNSRTHLRQSTGCPFCSGSRVWTGFNDLQTTHPKVAKLANGWDPTSVSAGSGKKREWICQSQHTWIASPHDQVKIEDRCPYCVGYKAWPGFNDLQTTHPSIAKELIGASPATIRPGSNKKYFWRCSQGHEWQSSVNDRCAGKSCPYCSGQKVLQGFNDLGTTHPDLALEIQDVNPHTISKGSNKKISWKCKLGHIWKSTTNQRTSGYGCPYCVGRKVWKGFNDLATTHPHLALEILETDPTSINQGSVRRVKWRCSEGHIWTATPNNRTANQSKCPSCSKSGFDPNQDGYLYLLMHPVWEMYQIGITNFPEKRLASHRRLGWSVMELRGPMEGSLAQDWETAILRFIAAKGGNLGSREPHGPFDGFTEAWSMDRFSVTNLLDLMRETEEAEKGKN